MKRIGKCFLAITLIIIFSACSVNSSLIIPVSHDLGLIEENTLNRISTTLDAPVWLWDERIRYRLIYDDETVVRYYHKDRWEAPVPALLERRLTITSKRPLIAQMQLNQFEQRFDNANNAYTIMDLTVSVFAEKGYKLLGKRKFILSQPTTSADVKGAINGFIVMTRKAKVEIQLWLETL